MPACLQVQLACCFDSAVPDIQRFSAQHKHTTDGPAAGQGSTTNATPTDKAHHTAAQQRMATAVSTLLAGIGSGRLTGTSKHYFRASCPTVPHGGHTDASTSHRGSWLAAHTARPEPSPLCHTPPAAPLMPCQMQNSHMKGGAVTATRKLPAKHIQYCYGGPSLQPAHRLRRALTHAHTAVCTPLSGALLMCPSWPIWVCGGQVCQPTLHNGSQHPLRPQQCQASSKEQMPGQNSNTMHSAVTTWVCRHPAVGVWAGVQAATALQAGPQPQCQ